MTTPALRSAAKLTPAHARKQVAFQATPQIMYFDEADNLESDHGTTAAEQAPGKSILVRTPATFMPSDPEDDLCMQCGVFYCIIEHEIRPLRTKTANAAMTLSTMNAGQNSLPLLRKRNVTRLQVLFIKHLLLEKIDMPNVAALFRMLYLPYVTPPTADQLNQFRCFMTLAQTQLLEIYFALECIRDTEFVKPYRGHVCDKFISQLLEKYFAIFKARDGSSATLLSTFVTDLICREYPTDRVLEAIAEYVPLKPRHKDFNNDQLYCLLTN